MVDRSDSDAELTTWDKNTARIYFFFFFVNSQPLCGLGELKLISTFLLACLGQG